MTTPEPITANARRSDAMLGTLLFLPALAVIVLLFVLPVLYELIVSLFRSRLYEQANPFVGWQNYAWLFRSGDFPQALVNTLVWTVGSVVGQAILGVFVAVVLMQDLPGRNVI